MELEYIVIRMRILLGTYCFCYVDDEKQNIMTKTITTFKIGKRNGGVRKKYTKIKKNQAEFTLTCK